MTDECLCPACKGTEPIYIWFEGEERSVPVTAEQFAIIRGRCQQQPGPWKPLKREHAEGVLE